MRSQLIDLIESGEYALNDRLPSEAELAQSFSVSRSVIREALHSLNALGLTKSYAGKGTFVASRQLSSKLLIGRYLPSQLSEVRRALEVPSARLAAERRTEGDLQTLEELVQRFGATTDGAKRVQVDADFHISIAGATNNPLFQRLIADLRSVLQEQALRLTTIKGRPGEAHKEHMAIYAAIAAGDGMAAARAMEAHLDAVEEGLGHRES